MGKMTDKRKKMIRGAAVFVVFAAIVVAVRAIKKKRRSRISYEPMHERDRQRIDYLNSKIWQCDVTCRNMLRFERAPFFRLCDILRDRKLLADSVHVSVEQQVAIFLHTVGHNVRNRVVATNFGRSFWTISIYFRRVLHAIERSQLKGNSKITPISSWTCPPHLPVRVHGDALISTPAPRRCSPLPPLISPDLRRPLGRRWLGHPSPSSGRSAGPGSAATRRPPPAATRPGSAAARRPPPAATRPGSAAARRPPPAAACPGSAARRGSAALPDRSPPLEVEAEVKEKKSTN